MHGDAQGKHPGQEEYHLPVDRPVGVLGPQHPRHHQRHAPKQGRHQDRDDIEGGQSHDGHEDPDGQRRLAAQEAARHLVENDEVVAAAQFPYLRFVRLDQQGIPQAEFDRTELLVDRLPPALDAQHQRPVAIAEVDLLEGVSDQPRIGRHQRLDEAQVLGLQGLVAKFEVGVDAQAHGSPEADQIGQRTAYQQDVVGLENPSQRRPSVLFGVEYPKDRDVVVLSESALQDRLSHQGGPLSHPQFGYELTQLVGGGQFRRLAVGEEPPSENKKEDHSGHEQHQAHARELEHGERPVARLFGDRTDQQVGGGPDQSTYSAELGGVGEGDQEFRGR